MALKQFYSTQSESSGTNSTSNSYCQCTSDGNQATLVCPNGLVQDPSHTITYNGRR